MMDKTFKERERERESIVILRFFSFFLNRFYKFYTVDVWKKNKNYTKCKFEIRWGMLRNKN